jgi:fructose-bisphosphate aldolase class I
MNEDIDTNQLEQTVRDLLEGSKGILAADESSKTCDKRFEAVGVEKTEDNRRAYRELLFTTPNLSDSVSGVILYDETFWQKGSTGKTLREVLSEQGVLPGIKVDEGLVDLPGLPGEQVTQGLDGLDERVEAYVAAGAKFAKWRAVIRIGEGLPTDGAIKANCDVLADYALVCQRAGLVPMVEPEVLLEGDHSIERCRGALERTLTTLFVSLKDKGVHLPGAILKTSMVLPGKDSGIVPDPESVAIHTSEVLKDKVPEELGGVVFLSGGQTPEQAMFNLNAIAGKGLYPWPLTFSYSRALQDPVLKYWAEHRDDEAGAQAVFNRQLAQAVKARQGQLSSASLGPDSFVSTSQD